MLEKSLLQPDLVLGSTIVNLNPEIFTKHQLKGLVLDVDDTLVPLRGTEVSSELQKWVEEMRKYVTIWLVSNNISQNRISRIANILNLPYLWAAAKPSRRKLRQVVQTMGLETTQVAMVGDRLFTDVLAGNRLGMFTILVEPMVDPHFTPSTFHLRDLEVWLSQALGVSLAAQHNFIKHDK